ncbi:MAG: homoserine O-acetyltransferase [Candidatus Auribacterota bacterium]|jgi:homoserine O-acetyltransferase|nr:homoserine O-acetyltransferase [Candidatus Auribacterota bacterium]
MPEKPYEQHDSVGLVKTQYYTFAEPPEELLLTCGKLIGPITVAYETYGKLSPAADNAILIFHALTGDAHAAGYHSPNDKNPGWWDNMIGQGKPFNTSRYFIICANYLCGCKGTTGPSSINPRTNQPYGLGFPMVTITDMVTVQKQLIDHLGIKKLLAIAGGSMGGMLALEWVTRYPESVRSACIIASTSRLSPQAIAFDAVGRNAIISDPNWNNGDYYGKPLPRHGLAIARMIGHITYLSDESMHAKFGRRLQFRDTYGYDFSSEFEVESYLHYQGDRFVERFDANSYLYITKAMDYFDLAASKGNGSLTKAFENVLAKMLVVSFTSDWLFPPYQSKEIVKALMNNDKDVSYVEIFSTYGHDAFLLEVEHLSNIINSFLSNLALEIS